jgi:uncharacterized protein (UPF0210 family)
MKIRSITCFIDPGNPIIDQQLQLAGRFIAAARPAFEMEDFEVQTARLATPPFPTLLRGEAPDALVELAQSLELEAGRLGFDYVSLGPALPDHLDDYRRIPDALAATQNCFFSGLMTTAGGGVSLDAVRLCAEVIARAAPLSPDGFANLRFAALANVSPGAPFFPAAYHGGGAPTFALALQAADLAVMAFSRAASVAQAQADLSSAMQAEAAALESVAARLEDQTGLRFGGIDFSLAPFPQAELSLGTALERLGVPALGLHGSLAAAAILADAMDRAQFRRAGFCGLMLPVLEDAILAKRAAEGTLGLRDLLLYSAVCGTGLDTVPLPGDTTADEIYPLLLDLACLAQRLDKPLTARLMPIPGKKAGDPTGFDFAYFANSQVMVLDARPLDGKLTGQGLFKLHPRPGDKS